MSTGNGSDVERGEAAAKRFLRSALALALGLAAVFATKSPTSRKHPILFCPSDHIRRPFNSATASPAMASKAAAPSARPNHTLYCSNLPDKLQKDDLKRALYMLFSVYGSILDIVALKTPKMRGQAHVLFRDVSSSTQAMRSLQGFEFFGKEMVCSSISACPVIVR